MREIKLTQGKVALVDDEDFDALNKFKWYASRQPNSRFYAERSAMVSGQKINIKMHRAVLSETNSKINIDHIDGNGLNNCRKNLRKCSNGQNQYNRTANSNSTSGIKGVCWMKNRSKWRVQIQANGKYIYVGLFENLELAISAHQSAAKKHHGEFANLNFPNH